MQTSVQRIGLFGHFGAGNLGNDGSLEAMLSFLRNARPSAELTCICADPAKIEQEHGLQSIRIGGDEATTGLPGVLQRFQPTHKLLQGLHAFARARKFDVIIMPGTGILDDFSDTFLEMPIKLFTWCLAARLWGARIAFVSVGAGPIKHPVSRWLMKAASRMAQYRSYRDTVSKAFMDSIGFNTSSDPITPDIAFGLPTPESVELAPGSSEPLIVGVGVMAYYGWRGAKAEGAGAIYEAYLAKMACFVLWLLDRGHPVRILMGETSDWRAVEDLLAIIASTRPDFPRDRIVAEAAHSLHDLMRQIARTHVVVATRFHNIVCAMKMCKPSISISYAKKNDVLMAEMGLGELCQHIECLDVDLLIKQFSALVAERHRHEQTMLQVNALYRARLGQQEQMLIKTLLSSG
jgi:polysaccharide pyruvyl transferase WcaK-like protein